MGAENKRSLTHSEVGVGYVKQMARHVLHDPVQRFAAPGCAKSRRPECIAEAAIMCGWVQSSGNPKS
jgi:hypothetical protein